MENLRENVRNRKKSRHIMKQLGNISDNFGEHIPDAPWCWNIYLHLGHGLGVSMSVNYSSTMVRIWVWEQIWAMVKIPQGWRWSPVICHPSHAIPRQRMLLLSSPRENCCPVKPSFLRVKPWFFQPPRSVGFNHFNPPGVKVKLVLSFS